LEDRSLPTTLAAPLHFDFGPVGSAVASGYTGVALPLFTALQGYGWQSVTGLSTVDRGTSNPLTSTFVSGSDATFLVNLPDGFYNVTPTLGDATQIHDEVSIYGEGLQLGSALTTTANQFITPTFKVQVTGGQLSLRFTDTASGGAFALDALDITAAPAPTSFATVNGIYALGWLNAPLIDGVLNNPNVAGLSVHATWAFMQPTKNNFNWSYFDGLIHRASTAGKTVILCVQAGVNTPSWVYSEGAQAFSFTDDKSPNTQQVPLPWDPVFLAEWENFVQQMGARYASNPTVVQVKVTGINIETPETRVPNSHGQSVSDGSKTWTTTNDTPAWQAAGYTRTKVETAWQAIADTFAKAFPTQQLAADLDPNVFPAIDNNGHIFSDPQNADNQIVTDIINRGISSYGAQFALQNDGLSTYWIYPTITAEQAQLSTGYQTLWSATGDPSYRLNGGKSASVPTIFQKALNRALNANAQFLEIYIADIQNSALQSELASAEANLDSNAHPLGTITGLPTGTILEGANTFTFGTSLADPTAVDATKFTYSWTVTYNGNTVASGAGMGFSFTAVGAGNYVVSLQVTDSNGVTSLVNAQTIAITAVAPTISIEAPTTGRKGQSVNFQAITTGVGLDDTLTFSWKFGDSSGTLGRNVDHVYTYRHTFEVWLTVTDSNGMYIPAVEFTITIT
jgi:hypothetical protein